MSKFISVRILERAEGSPGVVDPEEFNILINADEITMVNRGESEGVCFLRTTCGAALCVAKDFDDFVNDLRDLGIVIPHDVLPTVNPKKATSKKPRKKK